jgi:hypothetical protein
MLIATLDEALGTLIIGAGGIILALVGAALLFRWSLRNPRTSMKLAGSLVAALLGGGGLVIGGVVFLLGLAVAGCPPDANECPF